MPNKQIKFKHISGSYKYIPGIPDRDRSPRLKMETQHNSDAGGSVGVLVRDLSNAEVSIVLVNEDYEDLTADERKLPKALQESLEHERVENYQFRKKANKDLMQVLRHYEAYNEIEILGISDMTDAEVASTKSPIISLSEIAIADHMNRGIKIPESLKASISVDEKQQARERALKKQQEDQEEANRLADEAEATKKLVQERPQANNFKK